MSCVEGHSARELLLLPSPSLLVLTGTHGGTASTKERSRYLALSLVQLAPELKHGASAGAKGPFLRHQPPPTPHYSLSSDWLSVNLFGRQRPGVGD